jgi:hypothetical protein
MKNPQVGDKVIDGAHTTGTITHVSAPTAVYITSASGQPKGSVVDHLVTVDFDAHTFEAVGPNGKTSTMKPHTAVVHSIDLSPAPKTVATFDYTDAMAAALDLIVDGMEPHAALAAAGVKPSGSITIEAV